MTECEPWNIPVAVVWGGDLVNKAGQFKWCEEHGRPLRVCRRVRD